MQHAASDKVSVQSQPRDHWLVNAERILAQRRVPLTARNILEPSPESNATVNLVESLCSYCYFAISDVLTQTYPVERWLRLEGSDAVIAAYRQHHSNMAQELETSSLQRCAMCALVYENLRRDCGDWYDNEVCYSVFVKIQPIDTCRLRLCTGDVSRFTRPMREWEKSQDTILQFFSSAVKDQQNSDHLNQGCSIQCSQQTLLRLQKLPDLDISWDSDMKEIRTWQTKCDRDHKTCKAYRQRWLSESLPKRLVDISAMEAVGQVHLCFPKPEDKWQYATVSYSWGHKESNRRHSTKNNNAEHPDLTEANLEKGTKVDKFPQTLQDAMRVAQKLNIRYIWIDSLCIVQDDDTDKDEQIEALVQIYARAELNIGATSGLFSEYGILRKVAEHGICIGRIHPSMQPGSMDDNERPRPQWQHLIYVGTNIPVVDLEDMPAATRAWIFQERLASRATVHFTDTGLIWECMEHLNLNREQCITKTRLKSQWAAAMESATPESLAESPKDVREMVFRYWNQWIAAYAARDLSRVAERLYACSSMARTVQRRFDLRLVAGVWWEDIINSLLWRRDHRCESLKRFTQSNFPSWSWTSVQGRLNYMRKSLSSDSENGPVIKVIGIESHHEANSTKHLPFESIRLHGLIQKVTVDQNFHPGTGQRDSQEVGVVSGFMNVSNVMVLLDVPTSPIHRYEFCWFLRIGSYLDGSRRGDIFLVLQQVDEQRNFFRRIGFARTEPWFQGSCATLESGRFVLPQEEDVILI